MTLPAGWTTATIGDVADTRLGKMLDAAKNKGVLVPYLRNVNVRWGSFDLSDLMEMKINDDELAQLSVRDGDLFVCEGGEPGRSAVWRGGPRRLVFQKALHRVRGLEGVESDYLAIFLRHTTTNQGLDELLTGTTIRHLPQTSFQKLALPLPPQAEQRRIVAKLDTLAARLTRARALLARVHQLACQHRLAVLESVFAGFTSSPHITINDICKVGTGATPKRGERRYYFEGTIPWITSGAVNLGVVQKPTELITDTAIRETNCKIYPAGSLLVALYGEGKTRGMVATLGIDAATNQALAVLHSFDLGRVVPQWVKLFLLGRYEETRRAAAGGVQPNLNLGIIKAIQIPVPSLIEQNVGIERIERAFARAERVEAEAGRALYLLDRLEASILTKAFRGELVPQDPADEPASALLDRIRRFRETDTSPGQGRVTRRQLRA